MTFRPLPLSKLLLKRSAAVDFQLAVAEQAVAAFQGAGSGSFDVDAVFGKSAAVAGAAKLLLALFPARDATQVRAGGAQGVKPGPAALLAADHPHAMARSKAGLDVAFRIVGGKTRPEHARRLVEHIRPHQPGDSGRPAAEHPRQRREAQPSADPKTARNTFRR